MTIEELIKQLKKYPPTTEISLVYRDFEGEFGEERIKVWLHPEKPDNDKLNPEIYIP